MNYSGQMFYRIAVACLLFVSSMFFLAHPERLLAKSYTLDRVAIEARVSPEGNLTIEEARTYTFRGRYRWADYRLPLEKVGTVADFSLCEGEQMYREGRGEDPGTYQIKSDDDEFYVKWYYRARNETRTFVLSYTVTDVVTVYDDVAEFYYKFVGEANEKQIGAVEVTIHLPQPADTAQVRAWAHGPLWGGIQFENGRLHMQVSPLPAKQYWEARVLFPPAWVPEAARRRSIRMLSTIRAEEAEWARQANEERRRALQRERERAANERKAWPLAIGLSLAGFLGWGILYWRYGRGFQVPYRNKIDSSIPEDLSPVLASYVYFQKQVMGSTLMACLLDLARRGFVAIEQRVEPKRGWFSSEKQIFIIELKNLQWRESDELADFERELLAFLFEALAEGKDQVEFETLKKNGSKTMKWFKSWKKRIEALWEAPYWERKSLKATGASAGLSLLVIAGGVTIVVLLGSPGVLCLVSGGLCLALSFTILRYTPEVKLLRKKLEALRRYLKKYHFQKDDTRRFLDRIETYLIYAVALAVGTETIKRMLGVLPEHQHAHYFPWYLIHHGSAQPAHFAEAVSSFVSVGTSTMSSATGTGGGASAGGGGGGGGASGGAG